VNRRGWKAPVLGLVFAATGAAWAAAPKAPAVKKLGPPVRLTVGAAAPVSPADTAAIQSIWAIAKGGDASASDVVAPQPGGETFIVLHAEFDGAEACRKLEAPGVHVFSRFDRWADIFIPAGDPAALKAVTAAPGIVWVEVGRRVTVPPPAPGRTAASRSQAETIVRGGLSGLTGKGVVVAIVDSGIDFRHPDFITKDAGGNPVSRIRCFWDTMASPSAGKPGRPGPVAFPNGTPVGTLYTQEDLTTDLRAAQPAIEPLDTNGHGTACAGIAAGGGAALPDRRYTGVAPDAELIGVRIGPGPGLPNAYLMGAICDWIDSIAGKSPAVVSCSFGGQYAGRDGERVAERHLSARFAPEVPGRALCVAAGNEGASGIHAEISFAGETAPGVLTWNVPADATGGTLEVYMDSADASISLRTTPESNLDLRKGQGHVYPITKQVVWSIDLKPGAGELRLFSPTGAARKADAYVYGYGSRGRAEFTGSCVTFGKQVGTPGTAANAITVGSYDWNNEFETSRGAIVLADVIRTSSDGKPAPITIGGLSSYTCPGYTRTGTIKPDITAPGQYHIAAAPTQPIPSLLLHASGKYRPFNGTSAATPYVAGVIALMMQKKPAITAGEIRRLLQAGGTSDRFTGSIPNPRWGYGKLDLAAVQKLLGSVR
jgi:minor extracellular serine protease Vpr